MMLLRFNTVYLPICVYVSTRLICLYCVIILPKVLKLKVLTEMHIR